MKSQQQRNKPGNKAMQKESVITFLYIKWGRKGKFHTHNYSKIIFFPIQRNFNFNLLTTIKVK